MTTTKPWDPLNRIEPEGKLPYAHPEVDATDLAHHWRRFYEGEARHLGDDLAAEHAATVAAVADAEARMRKRPDAGALGARLVRLHGRRDALAAELARRSVSDPGPVRGGGAT